ncbi:hypothetical protein Tco_0566978 [Tanacetum coccineum]
MAPSLSFMQTNFVSDNVGTKFNDSRSKLSLQTFSMMNEIDRSGDGEVLVYSGSKISFRQALDLIFKLDKMTVGCTHDILRKIDCLDLFSEKLTTGRLIDGSPCSGIDMVVKDLDLEPKINAMMRDFFNPSWWKELSKEMGNKILPSGDGSYKKTFKLISSLIAKGKLK